MVTLCKLTLVRLAFLPLVLLGRVGLMASHSWQGPFRLLYSQLLGGGQECHHQRGPAALPVEAVFGVVVVVETALLEDALCEPWISILGLLSNGLGAAGPCIAVAYVPTRI